MALWVDDVSGVVHLEDCAEISVAKIAPMSCVEGLVKLDGDLGLRHNLDTFLSLKETTILDEALQKS